MMDADTQQNMCCNRNLVAYNHDPSNIKWKYHEGQQKRGFVSVSARVTFASSEVGISCCEAGHNIHTASHTHEIINHGLYNIFSMVGL